MPKKQAAANGPPPLSNRDHLERANFALQASLFLQAACAPTSSASAASSSRPAPNKAIRDRKGKRKASDDDAVPITDTMGRTTIQSFNKWTVHNQVKLDPSIKRSVCSCSAVLVPGLTCKVRIRSSKNHMNVIIQTCLSCGAQHRLPAPPVCVSNEGIDGPVRSWRRARKARRSPRHKWEQPQAEAVGPNGVDEMVGDDGPTVDKGGGKKGKKGGKGKSGNEGDGTPLLPGHVLWRGMERIGGWGTRGGEPDLNGARQQAYRRPRVFVVSDDEEDELDSSDDSDAEMDAPSTCPNPPIHLGPSPVQRATAVVAPLAHTVGEPQPSVALSNSPRLRNPCHHAQDLHSC